MRPRRLRQARAKTTALCAIAGSSLVHGGLLLALVLRPEPPPRIIVSLAGAGHGVVRAETGELDCGERCAARFEVGDELVLSAEPGEGSTFAGWPAPCEADGSGLDCRLVVSEDVHLEARFGLLPEEIEVAWLDDDALPLFAEPPIDVALPELAPSEVPEPELDSPAAADETLIAEPVEQAPEPEPEPEAEAPDPAPPPERSNLRSVEVPDENVVDEAPDDARFLSDQHRRVEEETHAQDTNLERQVDGETVHSEPSELEREEVGGPEDVIAHLETSEPTSLDHERLPESAHDGEEAQASGIEAGEEGELGDEAELDREPGMLAMRDIEAGAMPGGPLIDDERRDESSPGRPGTPGLDTRLSFDQYERIVGEDRVREEQALGRRQLSQREGRWERRQAALRSSLENFTPEVRPGNQTALSTRAEPFAVYIARMHRRIHELWGFGFLEDLGRKSPGHELNDWRLHTKLEIVIGPDGDVERTTIVEPSGVLAFDVAAIDVVQTAGPYEPPPAAIRSGNGRVYVHWSFHRDWRQCGTFGAHPFILDNAGDDADRGIDDGDLLAAVDASRGGRAERRDRRDPPRRAASSGPTPPEPDDPRVEAAVERWVGALSKGDARAMALATVTPLRSGGRVVAQTQQQLAELYASVIAEAESLSPLQSVVVSAAGYRRQFGPLPAGISAESQRLFLVVRLPGEQLTAVLGRQGDGEFAVIALER